MKANGDQRTAFGGARDLVPMPGDLFGTGTGGGSYTFALCEVRG